MSEHVSNALDAILAAMPAAGDAAIDVTVEPVAACFNLRGRAGDLAGAVAKLAGTALPLQPNRYERGAATIYWLGPDEWLLTSTNAVDPASWREPLTDAGGTLVDLTAGYVSLLVTGADVRQLFARGCTLDLHPAAFETGDCAQTGMAKCVVLIARESGENSFRLIVRRSFAEYLALWLRHAGEEFGIRFRKQE